MKETGLSVRSFRLMRAGGIWQRKIDQVEVSAQTAPRNQFLDSGLRLFDGQRFENRHVTDETAQGNVRITIGANEFQRVLRLAQMRSFRIRVDDAGNVWLRNQAQEQIHIETYRRVLEWEIGELVVDISVEDDEIRAGEDASGYGNAKTVGVE